MPIHYHVSAKDLGAKVVLTAKVPETAGNEECRKTARVCFAPSVWQCLMGVTGICDHFAIIAELVSTHRRDRTAPVVYRTSRKLFIPKQVSDYADTHEVWSLEDIEVTRHGYVDLAYLLKHGVVRTTKNPTYNVDEAFYEGFRAAQRFARSADWRKYPPVYIKR